MHACDCVGGLACMLYMCMRTCHVVNPSLVPRPRGRREKCLPHGLGTRLG